MICEKCLHKDVCSLKNEKRNSQFCEHYKDANEWLKIPCIAMIEQFVNEKAEFDKRCTSHNGKMAVVYRRSDYNGILIDITNRYYNCDVAAERLAAIKRESRMKRGTNK